jgi:DNA-binding CsgD family transcriptional regulator
MRGPNDILFVIDRLYDTVTAPERWSSTLDSLVDLVQADHAVMIGRGGGAPFIVSARVDERDLALALSAHRNVDHGPFAVDALPPGLVLTRSAVMPDPDYERAEHYNEIVRPLKGYHALLAQQQMPMHGFALSICRTRQSGDFEGAEGGILQAVLPHLKNMLELQSRLHVSEQRYAGLAQTIDRIGSGVILADIAARPVLVNAHASRLIDEADGLILKGNRLAAATPASTRHLHEAICAAADNMFAGSSRLHIRRPSGRLPLVLNLLPVSRLQTGVTGTSLPRVAIFITEPDAPGHIDRGAVADIFHLTQRESETALLLAEGLDLDTIAAQMGLGIGTVRHHLKRVYEKTGARSQSALVALLRGFTTPSR